MKFIGIIVGGLGLLAAIFAIGQITWTAKDMYDELTGLRAEIAGFDARFAALNEQTIRSEALKEELLALEQRLRDQDLRLATTSQQSNAQIEGLQSELAALESRLPKGVALPEVVCVALNKRVRVGADTAVEFCESDLIVSVGSIRTDENIVDVGHTLLKVPVTTDQGFGSCNVSFMSIDKSDSQNPRVDLRASC